METIAELHPIVVHFVIALGLVGIVLRVLSLLPFAPWSRHAATALLLGAAAAGALAVKSGEEAHGPAERIPGARDAVKEHEETGEQARNALFVVALLEIGALALRKREKVARGVYALSAVAGLAAGYFIYEAGEHGGELVYEYAGGIGTRTGKADPEDVQRLLIAGLYHQSRVARDAGNAEEAARLVDELVAQRGDDANVRLLGAESLLKDKQDPAGALAAIREFPGPADNQSYVVRRGVLESDIFVALGQADSARAILTDLQSRYPEARAVKAALEKLR